MEFVNLIETCQDNGTLINSLFQVLNFKNDCTSNKFTVFQDFLNIICIEVSVNV